MVNWQQEEPTGFDRKGGTSWIRREAYVRFCEGLGVKIQRAYSASGSGAASVATAPLLDFTVWHGFRRFLDSFRGRLTKGEIKYRKDALQIGFQPH